MNPVAVAGLVLTPGAGAGRDQPALVAVDETLSERGLSVERIEFPGRPAGRRQPDRPEVCIDSVRAATSELAQRLGVPTSSIAVGGRSMGGRMCSMAAAQGLQVAALVLDQLPTPSGGGARASPDRTLSRAPRALSLRQRASGRLGHAR